MPAPATASARSTGPWSEVSAAGRVRAPNRYVAHDGQNGALRGTAYLYQRSA